MIFELAALAIAGGIGYVWGAKSKTSKNDSEIY